MRLRAAYSGNALQVYDAAGSSNTMIGFAGSSNTLDAAALDTFLDSDVGKVTRWYDQIGSNDAQQNTTDAPKISTLTIGGHRGIVFEGGSKSGALFSLALPSTIAALNLGGQNYTVMALVQPSSSIHRNQASTPALSVGVMLSLETSGGATVAEIFADGRAEGGWATKDDSAFSFTTVNRLMDIRPQVLCVVSGAAGVSIFQNESVSRTSRRSATANVVGLGHIGKRGSASAGASNDCFDGMICALMVWDVALTERERAAVAASLYSMFSIDPSRSRRESYSVQLIGDSIPSGYTTLGIYGMAQRMAELLPQNVRVANFSVPGSTIIWQTGMPITGYNQDMFKFTAVKFGKAGLLGNVFIILGGGNDGVIQKQATVTMSTGTPGSVTWAAHKMTVDMRISFTTTGALLTGLTTGVVYWVVAVPDADTLTLSATKGGSSIAFSGTQSGTHTGTGAVATPAMVHAGIQNLTNQALAAGFSAVIVCTILPRVTNYQSFNVALNALILAGVTGATVLDLAADAQLSQPYPSIYYTDPPHPSAAGHARAATLLSAAVETALGI